MRMLATSTPQVGGIPRVLSIQSHVVSGYVGNKCAVFPLQLLGFEVDAVNSVQFSNHTGYPVVKGTVLKGDDLQDLMFGLEANSLIDYQYIITGYIGSQSMLDKVLQVLEMVKKKNPLVRYVCDPVMGDDGKMYLPQELLQSFKNRIIPCSAVITPNQFEAELLSGMKISSEQDALKVCEHLHDSGPDTVVITSLDEAITPKGLVVLIASTKTPQKPGQPSQIKAEAQRVKAKMTGTGDIFCALLLAWLHRFPDNLELAVSKSFSTLQGIIRTTCENVDQSVLSSLENSAQTCKLKELKIIQCRDMILNPMNQIQVYPIS